MRIEDFEIGKTFWTASGEWVCTDKGTKSVIAVKVGDENPYEGMEYKNELEDMRWEMFCFTWAEISENPYILGNNIIFYNYDLGGCELENTFSNDE